MKNKKKITLEYYNNLKNNKYLHLYLFPSISYTYDTQSLEYSGIIEHTLYFEFLTFSLFLTLEIEDKSKIKEDIYGKNNNSR